MIVEETEPGEMDDYIYRHKFGDLVSRVLTKLSLDVRINDCLIRGVYIEKVMAQMENILDTCQVINTKMKQERHEGKVPSRWIDVEASH